MTSKERRRSRSLAVAAVAAAVVSGRRRQRRSRRSRSRSAGRTTRRARWRRSTARRSRPRSAHRRRSTGGPGAQAEDRLTCDTQGNKPAVAKSCAAKLLGQGADIIFTTCDVDLAAPVVQESINAREAHGRAVHRHRSDGPEALRRQGPARVLVRQRRPGRGLGDGRVRVEARLADARARHRHGDRLLPNVVQAFEARWQAARRQDRRRGDVPVRSAATRPRGRTSSPA